MRVLILSSSTGGGHDMRAGAFQEWAQLLPDLNLTTELHRPLDSGPPLYRFGVHLYNWIQRRAPYLHHIYFNFLEVVAPCGSSRSLLGADRFRATLESMRPDVLFSVHGSLNHGFFDFARSVLGRDRIRCVTYCGELHGGYGFSRNWVNPNTDLFIGAVAETCDAALSLGMPEEKTNLGGFLLRPQFYDASLDDAARRAYVRDELEFEPEEFILLLSASSRGANNHIAFLNALRRARLDVQVVVLCGKSQTAPAQIADWISFNQSARVRIIPPDTNVATLLHCVSAVLARPGTGATSEAIVSHCPLLLNCLGGIMPQEWITVKFCRKHRVAETIRRADDLARIVDRWMESEDETEAIRARMNAVCPTATPRDILSTVARRERL